MYTYKIKVDRVVDGDTVDVFIDLGFSISVKQRIRLIGIDAPESRTRDLVEKEKGLAAKAWLDSLLLVHKDELTVKTQLDKTGKFGRVLGEIFIDGNAVSVNQQMLHEGHAVVYGK